MDTHLRPGANVGPFSLPREIAGIALLGAVRRSPVTTPSLAVGAIARASAGLSIYEVVSASGDIGQILFLIVLAMTFLIAIPAGLAAAWLQPETGEPHEL